MSCSRCKHQNKGKTEMPCLECMQNRAVDHFKPMTNADRIRNMTDEELAELLLNDYYCEEIITKRKKCLPVCKECLIDWLQAEVEEEQ